MNLIINRTRQFISLVLGAVVIVLSPGLGCYDAAAALIRAQGGQTVQAPAAPRGLSGVAVLPAGFKPNSLVSASLTSNLISPQSVIPQLALGLFFVGFMVAYLADKSLKEDKPILG